MSQGLHAHTRKNCKVCIEIEALNIEIAVLKQTAHLFKCSGCGIPLDDRLALCAGCGPFQDPQPSISALRGVMELIDAGWLVRDFSKDLADGHMKRSIDGVMALKAAAEALGASLTLQRGYETAEREAAK